MATSKKHPTRNGDDGNSGLPDRFQLDAGELGKDKHEAEQAGVTPPVIRHPGALRLLEELELLTRHVRATLEARLPLDVPAWETWLQRSPLGMVEGKAAKLNAAAEIVRQAGRTAKLDETGGITALFCVGTLRFRVSPDFERLLEDPSKLSEAANILQSYFTRGRRDGTRSEWSIVFELNKLADAPLKSFKSVKALRDAAKDSNRPSRKRSKKVSRTKNARSSTKNARSVGQ